MTLESLRSSSGNVCPPTDRTRKLHSQGQGKNHNCFLLGSVLNLLGLLPSLSSNHKSVFRLYSVITILFGGSNITGVK